MNTTEFVALFVEFLNENSDNKEVLKQFKMFFEYGWGDCPIELINMLKNNGASDSAIKAVEYTFDV